MTAVETARGLHRRAPRWTPQEQARWPNFAPGEFDCKGSGEYYHDPEFLDKLQTLRRMVGKPLKINSAHRSERHNRAVGGVPDSRHRKMAVDISLNGHDRVNLVRCAIQCGFTGIGFGKTFLHLDTRPNAVAWRYSGPLTDWAKAFGFDPLARFRARGLRGLL